MGSTLTQQSMRLLPPHRVAFLPLRANHTTHCHYILGLAAPYPRMNVGIWATIKMDPPRSVQEPLYPAEASAGSRMRLTYTSATQSAAAGRPLLGRPIPQDSCTLVGATDPDWILSFRAHTPLLPQSSTCKPDCCEPCGHGDRFINLRFDIPNRIDNHLSGLHPGSLTLGSQCTGLTSITRLPKLHSVSATRI